MSLKSGVLKIATVSLVTSFAGVAAVLGTVEGISQATTGESAVMGEAAPTFLDPLVIGALAGAGLTGYAMGRWDASGTKPASSGKKPEQPAP